MNKQVRRLLLVSCALAFSGVASYAQTAERGPARAEPQSAGGATSSSPATAQLDAVAAEIGPLRKSLQALSAGLREFGAKASAPAAESGDALGGQQNRISLGLELLSRA